MIITMVMKLTPTMMMMMTLAIIMAIQGNENGIQSAASCQGMTPSERLIWLVWSWSQNDHNNHGHGDDNHDQNQRYRANQPAVELDAERCAQSSNYRQVGIFMIFMRIWMIRSWIWLLSWGFLWSRSWSCFARTSNHQWCFGHLDQDHGDSPSLS